MFETLKHEKVSQHTKIIRELRSAGQKGIPNHRFSQMHILSHTKRIQELRRDGWVITIEREWRNGKATGTFWYKLIESKEAQD